MHIKHILIMLIVLMTTNCNYNKSFYRKIDYKYFINNDFNTKKIKVDSYLIISDLLIVELNKNFPKLLFVTADEDITLNIFSNGSKYISILLKNSSSNKLIYYNTYIITDRSINSYKILIKEIIEDLKKIINSKNKAKI